MKPEILLNNAVKIDEWDDLLQKSNYASYFQSYSCFKFYASLNFLKPFVIAVKENDKLVALVCGYLIAEGNPLKRIFTRRAIIPGGLLFVPECSPESYTVLFNELKKYLKNNNAIYIEFRNYHDYSLLKDTFRLNDFQYQPHLNFHIQVKDAESAFQQLNTTKRRDVRLSQKNGAIWYLSGDKNDMADYYAILSNLYKTRIKTPLFPESFFQQLIETDCGRFLVVKVRDEVIGGSVCVELPGRILYEWFVCGKDGAFKNIFPSTVATWAAIEYAANNGLIRFDMMGAGKPDEGYGVREFKSKFGGELVEYGRFLHVLNPALYALGKKIVQLLKRSKK